MASTPALERHFAKDLSLSEDMATKAAGEAEKNGIALATAIAQLGFSTPEEVYRSLAQFCDMRYVKPSALDIAPEVAENVPARFATHYNFIPIEVRNGTVVVAVSDPLNSHLLDDIRLVLKKRVEAVVATPLEIERSTKTLYGLGADTVEKILSDADGPVVRLESTSASMDIGDEKIDASIIKFVNQLFAEAIESKATDIHIEPFEEALRVRFRIDGVLHPVPTPASIRGFQGAIVSRVKVMANMNIAEKRLPQDGKIQASIGEGRFDLRVSILPTPYGETINVRILTRASMFMTLEELGFRDNDLTLINSFIKRPHGIILVTGPTGSGKSTTLYASLNKLNDMDRKTITIEDPIEYQLHGITQMQVLPQIGFNFSMGLRSMLRHDPDIMMVGEIRDYETAEMAIRASLTGHLVFSTLHTNDAAGSVTRLTDMGVEPFLISSTMIASIAQRLVRKICAECAETIEPDPTTVRDLRLTPEQIEGGTFRRGTGCELCRNTGYSGRIAIVEILPFTDQIKDMTVNQETSTKIRQKGRELGMSTLREAGLVRALEGETTLEEVLRVTADSDA